MTAERKAQKLGHIHGQNGLNIVQIRQSLPIHAPTDRIQPIQHCLYAGRGKYDLCSQTSGIISMILFRTPS